MTCASRSMRWGIEMKLKKDKRYQVFFTIKGVVEIDAPGKAQAETWVAYDPIGLAKGDVDMDFKVKEVKE